MKNYTINKNSVSRITVNWLRIVPFFSMLTVLFLFVGCDTQPPMTKEAYLQSFQALVEYADRHCQDVDESRFRTMDAVFELHSQDLYETYYPQLSPEEKRKIWGYRLTYLKCKAARGLADFGGDIYRRVESGLTHPAEQ